MAINSTNTDTNADVSNTEIADDTLPEGLSDPRVVPTVASTNTDTNTGLPNGFEVTGVVRSGDDFVPGSVEAVYAGDTVGEVVLDIASYTLTFLPGGVADGANVTGTKKAVFRGQSGGRAETPINSKTTDFDVALGKVSVAVEDARGNPLGGAEVTIAGADSRTASDGSLTVPSSGSTNLSLFGGSITETVDVPSEGTVSRRFAAAGVEGRISTPTGDPVEQTRVVIRDSSGDVIRRTRTDGEGNYEVYDLPPGLDVTVEAGGFTESVTLGGEQTVRTRNLPRPESAVGVRARVTDARTGDPVLNAPVSLLGESGLTNKKGVGRAVAPASQVSDDTVATVGNGDSRYAPTQVEVTLTGGDTAQVEVELERAQNIGQSN